MCFPEVKGEECGPKTEQRMQGRRNAWETRRRDRTPRSEEVGYAQGLHKQLQFRVSQALPRTLTEEQTAPHSQ